MKRRLPVLVLAFLASFGQARAASSCPPGFAALQNSDACVRVSGRVGADALVGSPRTRSSDVYETRVRERVQLELRKPTEFGPFRGVIRAEGVGR
jgi:hypothetical protein